MGFEPIDLGRVTQSDTDSLVESQKHYGDSWKQRGGVGAFMMLARKWDRIENRVSHGHYDIFEAIAKDDRAEGIIDDIRDLRRYLVLVEAEMASRGIVHEEVKKGTIASEPDKNYTDKD